MTDFKKMIYYKLTLTLASPLSVGSGENDYTDHDVIVDANGRPFIPATAIAGVMRSSFDDIDTAKNIFGHIPTLNTEEKDQKIKIEEKNHRTIKLDKNGKILETETDDRIRFYDARLISADKDNWFITNRDSVKLKDKIGVKGAKFDLQAVETGAQFVTYIELLDENYADKVETCIAEMNAGIIRLGTKTTRGYGEVRVEALRKDIPDINMYLAFGMYKDESWDGAEKLTLADTFDNSRVITLSLKSVGGIAIREYSTDVGMPDYKTLTLHSNGTPVVPGTSWAGAFRSRFEEIVGEYNKKDEEKVISNALFGQVITTNGKDTGATKSNILFSESQVEKGVPKDITRNAIDRFSGATKDGALYNERTCYFGETELEITLPKDIGEKEKFALAAVIADLHNGFLAVGGLTSVGRGIFEVTAVNGNRDIVKYIDADSLNIAEFIKEVF